MCYCESWSGLDSRWFQKAKLQKGESKFLKNDGVVVVGIGRINVIYFATSAIHGLEILQNILKEKMVILWKTQCEYNEFMNGINLFHATDLFLYPLKT